MRRLHLLPTALAIATAAGLSTGCPTREVSNLDPHEEIEIIKDIPVDINRDVDILFVIDDSGSMSQEQQSLAANTGRFMEVLNDIKGGLPNVHIGVLSSNVGVGDIVGVGGCPPNGDGGRLQNTARSTDCVAPSGFFISDIADADGVTRIKNYTGALADTFSCIARLGTDGCGFEQHLESMKRALDGSVTQNKNFIRDSAYLAVIILADEDDCSAKDDTVFDPSQRLITDPLGIHDSFRCTEFGVQCCDAPGGECDTKPIIRTDQLSYTKCEPRGDSYLYHPQKYVDFLKDTVKPNDPDLLIVAAITGQPSPFSVYLKNGDTPTLSPSCESELGEAAPAVRLDYFLKQFKHNTFQSICQDDLSQALNVVATELARFIGTPCIDGQIETDDIDPVEPGLQLNCQVTDTRFPGEAREEQTVIRRCDMVEDPLVEGGVRAKTAEEGQVLPCWWSAYDPENCTSTVTQLILNVERGGYDPPRGTHVIAHCIGLTAE